MAAGVFVTPLLVLFYQRVWYDRVFRPRYKPSYTPRCSIIIPCKGVVRHLEDSVRAYLHMDYPDFEVVYAVEREDDPALEVIRRVVGGNSRASVVVAGLSEGCCQKNWNMLAAVRKAANPEVYVFADADLVPQADWLRELILPLSSQTIAATTGFRWLLVKKGTVGEFNHVFFNGFLYILFTVASYVNNIGLWGGAMAMRRNDFEELQVAARWAETAVDDLSLAEIIVKSKRTSVLVPACVTETDDAIGSLAGSVRWIERQMMYLKAYHTSLWVAASAALLFALPVLAWLPVAAVLAAVTPRTFLSWGGAGPLLLVVADFVSALWYPTLGRMPRFGKFLLMQPVVRYIQLVSLARTMLTNTITWSGVEYKVHIRSGKVLTVTRPEAGT